MTTQNNPLVIGKAIQYQIKNIVSPVPVYQNFNRNFATEAKFITWTVRNIHQPVYTGSTQSVKGIDRPTFQINIYAQDNEEAYNISNQILQSLHGYSGMFGNALAGGFYISKADVVWLYNTYDNEIGLNQIVLDCTIDIPT
jgi:hypothetical protein